MFRIADNVFEKVKCPDLNSSTGCSVVNCLFDHGPTKNKAEPEESSSKRSKPNETATTDKAHVINEVKEKDVLFVVPKALSTDLVLPRVERTQNTKKIARFLSVTKSDATPNKLAISKEYEIASASRNVTGYRDAIAEFLCEEGRRVPTEDLERILPIELNPSPALFPVRRRYVELFAEAIKRQNPLLRIPKWTATQEEYKIASTTTSSTYNVAVKRKLYLINHPEKNEKVQRQTISKERYLKELRGLCIDKEKLIKFGFVMEPPGPIDEPEIVRTCHRCKLEFKLPTVEEEYDCRYHSGKVIKSDLNERTYSCCGGVVGATDTDPCSKSSHHVFYWLNPSEMHHCIPYVDTRNVWGTRKGSLEAVGIDCEMGFTSKGFELLRITAIDFFSGEEVIDELVRPKGTVLDLNTQWSGIAEIKQEATSLQDSITLLGEVIDSNTVLVGHGLENDMNAMRLIHHKIIDTAVLYPRHKATPTFRYSLKQLAFQYLGRNIQAGEHDSGEDSLAAIDVTKFFIEENIKRSQRRAST